MSRGNGTILTTVNPAAKIRQEAHVKVANSAEDWNTFNLRKLQFAVIRITNVIDQKFDRHFPVA